MSTPRTPTILAPALAAVLACGGEAVSAQRASSWAGLRVAGGVNQAAIGQLGKLLYYLETDRIHVFSAFTRRWHTQPLAPNAQLRNANDWLLIREGDRHTAFSSMRGAFATLTARPGATIVNPQSQRNDSLILVLDGDRAHAFSGFTGQWSTQSIGSAARAAVQRHVALVADGANLHGISAFDGRWVNTTAAGPVQQVFADGTAGLATTAGRVYGFAAQRGTWSSHPALAGSALAHQMDVAIWVDLNQALAFSGLRGSFALQITGVPATVTVDQQIAAAAAGNNVFFYSAVTGTWAQVATQGPQSPQLAAATGLVVEANRVHAFSGLRGAARTLAMPNAQTGLNASLAYAFDGQELKVYSAMTGQWHPAPADAVVGHPQTATNGALLRRTGGYHAFSARSGRFVPLAANGQAVPHVDANSSLLSLEEPGRLHVFAPGREVWLTSPLTSATPSIGVWRTTLIAVDGRRAIGFGSQDGEIETIALPEDSTAMRASSENGRVETAHWLYGYSPVPDLVTLAQFPEFRRVFVRGSALDLQLHGPIGAAALAMLGRPAASPIVLSIGTVYLDPPTHVPFPLGPADADGHAEVRIAVPDVPQLAGLEAFFQAAVLPQAGQPYLTRVCSANLY